LNKIGKVEVCNFLDMIRVGSRSKSEKLQVYNLSVKKKYHESSHWIWKLNDVYSKKGWLQVGCTCITCIPYVVQIIIYNSDSYKKMFKIVVFPGRFSIQ